VRVQHLSSSRRYLGPSALWLDDEDEATTYKYVLANAAETLAVRLKQRLAALQHSDVSADDLLYEIRRQIAESGVDGYLVRAADLSDLALEIASAAENQHDL
jgi:uncharacterized protein YbjT (DUF2867 family)